MRFAVIYYSRWGNCEKIARSIAAGLASRAEEVYLSEIECLEGTHDETDCLVFGSPTGTGRPARVMRRFIKRFVGESFAGKQFVAFSTGLESEIRYGNRQAADELHEILVRHGLRPLSPPFKAAVTGLKGPLVDGEEDRARRFGEDLATTEMFKVSKIRRPRLGRAV
jgi:flavodoxin